jgi:metal-responsive CopG/Arc/MetJ family transcriptional regulator
MKIEGIKTELRRSYEHNERTTKILVYLPESLLLEIDRLVVEFNPDRFYNRSHFINCAIIKQIRELIKELDEVKKWTVRTAEKNFRSK